MERQRYENIVPCPTRLDMLMVFYIQADEVIGYARCLAALAKGAHRSCMTLPGGCTRRRQLGLQLGHNGSDDEPQSTQSFSLSAVSGSTCCTIVHTMQIPQPGHTVYLARPCHSAHAYPRMPSRLHARHRGAGRAISGPRGSVPSHSKASLHVTLCTPNMHAPAYPLSDQPARQQLHLLHIHICTPAIQPPTVR